MPRGPPPLVRRSSRRLVQSARLAAGGRQLLSTSDEKGQAQVLLAIVELLAYGIEAVQFRVLAGVQCGGSQRGSGYRHAETETNLPATGSRPLTNFADDISREGHHSSLFRCVPWVVSVLCRVEFVFQLSLLPSFRARHSKGPGGPCHTTVAQRS
jgi:hypothetical protein